jgi:mitosis inhibitor protein kinase SWE1
MSFNPDNANAPVNPALSRLGGDGSGDSHMTSSTSSPLKRSDAIMNLDQASLGSPVAKRRSLHGSASFGHDFNVFDHGPPVSSPHFDIHDDSNNEYELSTASFAPENSNSSFASMPRRSSSLRKSTLQQRHGEKTSWGRRYAAQVLASQQLASPAPEVATPNPTKNRPRLSLDQFMPPMARDSPFSSQGSLPSSSMHMLNPPTHQPHPLSRTMTTSSSSSSILDESPTHVPARFGEQPRPKLDFSKSLPAGSLRPISMEGSSTEASGSFSTPQNYKTAKPLPAAFMSTGLISKFNRHPEEQQAPRGAIKGAVPDTPCKKHVNVFATYPALVPGSAVARARHIRHSFGTPSTPFNPHGSQASAVSIARGAGVFGSAFGNNAIPRRGSFLSADGDDHAGSPDHKGDSQSSVDMELPPTPTRQALASGLSYQQQSGGSPSSHRSLPAPAPSRIDFGRLTPHTPQESMLPPDPRSLSVSTQDGPSADSASMPPPATPTTNSRDQFAKFGGRHLSTTPVSAFGPSDRDESLSSRFEKFEIIGTGEFSRVYRVRQTVAPDNTAYFGSSNSQPRGRSPPAPMVEQVFAVKKSRVPYQGPKDRLRKLQEVNVLRALGRSDHVIHLIDSWEERNHLYIQTEYCEEGSLDLFLSDVGRKGRLDDFRIWKIMLELSQVCSPSPSRTSSTNHMQGLAHIHDSGYIHLDLKPANILITFEGVLKIGDFGMATAWPAQSGVEGEGDREYIGPEILLGQYDKPADVFALGLIMLEIAGNVQLPDNGPTWQRLRSGDMSDVPSLTWSEGSTVLRDANGTPVEESDTSMDSFGSDDELETDFGSPTLTGRKRNTGASSKSISHDAGNLFGSMRRGELNQAPAFMKNMYHDHALDRFVRWMISPNPRDRPTMHQVLESQGLRWVGARRRAGATVFEGNWGPADDILADDAEMMDF